MSEKSDTFKLVNAIDLAKEARVGMELTYFDVVALIDDLREENANLTARIAELERDFDMLFRAVIAASKQSRKNTQTQTIVYGKESEE